MYVPGRAALCTRVASMIAGFGLFQLQLVLFNRAANLGQKII